MASQSEMEMARDVVQNSVGKCVSKLMGKIGEALVELSGRLARETLTDI